MGGPPAPQRGYAARVEAFLQEIGGSPKRALAAEAVSAFLGEVAREGLPAGGYVRQLLDVVVASAARGIESHPCSASPPLAGGVDTG